VHISAYHRKTRAHADLLYVELTRRQPSGFHAAGQNVAPLLEALGICLHVVDEPPAGCSVAGSCDHLTQAITVVRASRGRMRFTALHELGHLLGEDLDAFQDAVYAHGRVSGRQVEEDACDAFASVLLLPDEHLDHALSDHGLSARGLRDLISTGQASKEAYAVAVAQRLASPGYALIVDRDGITRFAARSGDVLPIRRGADQSGSDLRTLLAGGPPLRIRGSLSYAAGSDTHDLYVDAIEHDGLILGVACESDPDWPQLQTPTTRTPASGAIDAHCSDCGIDFTDWRRCTDCGEPRHDLCGRCGCDEAALRGERMCLTCFLVLPPSAFAGASTICRSCSE